MESRTSDDRDDAAPRLKGFNDLPTELRCMVFRDYLPSSCKAFVLYDMPEFSDLFPRRTLKYFEAMRSLRPGLHLVLGRGVAMQQDGAFLVSRREDHLRVTFLQMSTWQIPGRKRPSSPLTLATSFSKATAFLRIIENRFVFWEKETNVYVFPDEMHWSRECFAVDFARNVVHWIDGKDYPLTKDRVLNFPLFRYIRRNYYFTLEVHERRKVVLTLNTDIRRHNGNVESFIFLGSFDLKPVFSNECHSKYGFNKLIALRGEMDLKIRCVRDKRIRVAVKAFNNDDGYSFLYDATMNLFKVKDYQKFCLHTG